MRLVLEMSLGRADYVSVEAESLGSMDLCQCDDEVKRSVTSTPPGHEKGTDINIPSSKRIEEAR